MPLTFDALAGIANDPSIVGRVRVAATRVAMLVANEATTGAGGDLRWSKRQRLARAVIDQTRDDNGVDVINKIVWGVIGVIDVTGSNPTDAELQEYVNEAWDELAGVLPHEMPPP